ncbi:unnamed protein product [Bursaphelenchus xylophilus]|uniref:Mediator of RNA polymerase II transcription subunit 8 n=1 Tax=Bursaphelenchus xylophilus TaxID=6326 RepID=A0A1I7RYA4_BURXY|nr:unnamed protein product [Bursaphelenchus xylophilus]CAG9085514.1 unnamed protein product [Bursaphelenchus xylophilus]
MTTPSENDRALQAVNNLEQYLIQVKSTIIDLIVMLEMQDRVPYPELLDQFASLAGSFTEIQNAMRKGALPSAPEDGGLLLKNNVLVPTIVSMEEDKNLETITEGRIRTWSHDVVPDYMRTKLCPAAEEEETRLDNERQQKATDSIAKQIQAMNKHIDSIVSLNGDIIHKTSDKGKEAIAFDANDTKKLVRAIMKGEGLKPKAPAMHPMGQMPPSVVKK